MRRPISLRAPSDEVGECVRCGSTVPADELNRHFWCPECLAESLGRARRAGRFVGLGVALAAMGYILLVVQPDLSLIPAVWAAILIAAYALGSRLGSELFLGWDRARSRTDRIRP